MAAKLLWRALDILESVDVLPEEPRDPTAITASVQRLRGAAAMVGHAADLLDDAASLGAENERRWPVVGGRVLELAALEGMPARA